MRKALERLKVVDYDPVQEGKVFFGAWVTIVDEDDNELTINIVGYDEIFGRKDCISIDSPMARALLGKSVDDEALVRTEAKSAHWTIDAIWYDKPNAS